MTRTPLRVAFVLAVAFGGAAAGTASGADSIGAIVQSRVYLSEARTLAVQNQSTIAVRFTVEPAGGIGAEPDAIVLEPDAIGSFTVTGEAGSEPVRLTVRVEQLTQRVGVETTALAFPVLVAAERPWTPPWGLALLAAAIGAGVGSWAILRRRRRS